MMHKAASQETFEAPGQSPCAIEQMGRWRFTAGLIAGMTIALVATLAPSLVRTAAARQQTVRPKSPQATEPDDEVLAARWEALYARFLDTAAPLVEAFHRVDRLAEELPERQIQVREADAAYRAALRAREAADAELARYLEQDAVIEQATVQAELKQSEAVADEARAKMDKVRRVQQKLIASWTALGRSQQTAESAAKLFYQKDVWFAENRIQHAQLALQQAKARRDLILGFEQTRKTMLLRAEVEARRAQEFACLAARERASTRQSQIEARLARSDLSRAERRLLDGLLKAMRKSGFRPAPYADRSEVRAFLDRFEAGLAGAEAVSRRLRSERYADLVERLVLVRERLANE
jgi:hypothetical protein